MGLALGGNQVKAEQILGDDVTERQEFERRLLGDLLRVWD